MRAGDKWLLLKGYSPALILMCGTLSIAASVEFQPGDPQAVVAIFPPWWRHADVLTAAASAGLVQALGASANVVFLRSDRSDLPERATKAGALFVLPGSGFGLCGGS